MFYRVQGDAFQHSFHGWVFDLNERVVQGIDDLVFNGDLFFQEVYQNVVGAQNIHLLSILEDG